MQHFIIFSKKGFVIYEEGVAPSFLNVLIQGINPTDTGMSKKIRDDLVEYQIHGQIVYLAISRAPVLGALVKKFAPIVTAKGAQGMITPDDLAEAEIAERNEAQGRRNKVDGSSRLLDLDYSEKTGTIRNVVESITSINLKRAFGMFSNRIEVSELGPLMEEHLVRKNVDPSFSKLITSDIVSQFTSAGKTVVSEKDFKGKMSSALGKLLPSVDHSLFVKKIKEHAGVYSICFVGVNGVGKSTSLAKVACWLIQSGLKVYIAACDTFRAGAVEQLKVHVERFNMSGHSVGFYESGYAKDDAAVAKFAIARAEKEGYDVVLIDTAGRMHNKNHLMQSLNKLIKLNKPNHILFVGEALVGGDSLAHIKEFNRWIAEGQTGKKIDSIMLTKVDTVDDRIGQILNLSFSASSPILFLGIGQANSDLIPMDPDVICELLVS